MTEFEQNAGKINQVAFEEILLPKCGHRRGEIITGPGYGVDVAVVDLGNNLGMAVSSDPLSLIPSLGLRESAWLSVHLLANDMATTGFSPMYAQFVLNLPTSINASEFEEYWDHIHSLCNEIGVAITGGHTCRIEGQNSTISGGGTMFLTAPLHEIITSKGAEPGDVIVVTKETAMASSSILAMSFPEIITQKLGTDIQKQGCELFYRTSSLKDALCATEVLQNNSELKAMHDVTEGGVLGAVCEIAKASGCGFRIDDELLPVGEAQKQITALFGIDHRYCVGAGSMIMVVKKGMETKLINHLHQNSIKATAIGEMTPVDQGCRILENGLEKELSFDGTDPYWGAFFKALKEGWK